MKTSRPLVRRVWRYQRGNQNPYIEEEQTTQWPKKKYKRTNNNLQNTHKTKHRVTRTPIKNRGELRCCGRVSSSCSTSGTRRVNLTSTCRTLSNHLYTYYQTKVTMKQTCMACMFFKCWNQNQHDRFIVIYFISLLEILLT